jgi:hypothetical protein
MFDMSSRMMFLCAGYIAESCVLNASFVLPGNSGGNQLVTPTFERALNGTTVRQVLAMAQDTLIKEVPIREVFSSAPQSSTPPSSTQSSPTLPSSALPSSAPASSIEDCGAGAKNDTSGKGERPALRVFVPATGAGAAHELNLGCY